MQAGLNVKISKIYPKPVRLLVIITLATFVLESSIMEFWRLLPPFPPLLSVLLDALLLAALLIPVLYFFLYRPMLVYIIEQKRLEQEITRLDKLNLLGEMAASIAHELRNPMTTVRGFLQILSDKQDCLRYKDHFDLMVAELDRGNEVIGEFLFLARNKPLELKQINLNTIVNSVYPQIFAEFTPAGKHLKLQLSEVPDLHLDEKEISQLVLNLCRNGLEAMSTGGSLTIKTYSAAHEVVLAIQDQGPGIHPDSLEKLGIPFFTTKKDGTGLGLAVCYSIASRHAASIEVQNSNRGATFLVRFPGSKNH